jgi:hypothetical protein
MGKDALSLTLPLFGLFLATLAWVYGAPWGFLNQPIWVDPWAGQEPPKPTHGAPARSLGIDLSGRTSTA